MFDFITQTSNAHELSENKIEDKLEELSESKINNISLSIPIVLIDNSGSTSSLIGNLSTLKYELKLIQDKLTTLRCQECYLMFWNSSEIHCNEAIKVSDLFKVFERLKIRPTGGTDISVAIHNIPDSWYQKQTHIFVVTDGEVNQDRFKFTQQVFNLAKKYININIITVETNNCDYMTNTVTAGSNIFNVLQNNKMTKYVRQFECYNNFHKTEPFINLCNPQLDKGEFSFKEYVFKDEKFNEFVNIICEIINHNNTNSDYLDKLMYFIAFTIFSYTKNKSQRIKNEVVRLFTSLFEEVFSDTKKLTDIFESEIVAHIEGTGKTFQQYKENRKKLFEKTLDDLKFNVMECFTFANRFMSFIINTKNSRTKKILESNITNSYVRLSDTYYHNGGISYGNHLLPMLPLNCEKKISNDTNNDTENYSSHQALRQWIRAIYARIHQIQVNDERILYLFLTDMMSVALSDLPEHIKNGYRECARIMLDAKRFNSGDLKQIVFLTMGNKPKPMITGYFTIEEILQQCKNHFNEFVNISLDELWYGICLTFNDEKLIAAQIPDDYDRVTLLHVLKIFNITYSYENIIMKKELNYQDYLTLEDISETGGYQYPDYKYGKKIFKSTLLISNNTYANLIATSIATSSDNWTLCPITGSKLNLNNFIKIPPKITNINNIVYDDNEYDMKIFNKQYFQKVNLIEFDWMNIKNLPMHSIDSYDFTNYPYDFYPPVPIITEKLYKEKEQYISLPDFKNQLKLRFDWLNNIDMTNIVIAGGFNKSIILDEKVNDIDIYIHMNDVDENNEKYTQILSRVVKDITRQLNNKYNDNIAYLIAYKLEFNVYEIIFFENIKNLQKEAFEIQDLTQMKYITKIQIIMKKHMSPEDIFNTYDIDACNTMYNSNDGLFFNERAYLSYRYLISIPRIDNNYTDIFDMRLLKYYKSGYRIALPRLTIDQIKDRLDSDNNLVINKCKFHVQQIENHNIYVDKYELLVEKKEKDYNEKLNQTGVRVYNSIVGDIGSLDNGRSIVKFMKYVQRQNKLVERVKTKLNEGQVVNEELLLSEINKEMNDDIKKKLKELKLRGKKYIKQEVLLSDNESDNDESINDELANDQLNKNELDNDINDINNVNDKNNIDLKQETIHIQIPKTIQEIHNVDNVDKNIKQDECNVQELKDPSEYIRVYYKVSTSKDTREINEFDNGTFNLKFIWTYEEYHKSKDWYNSNVEEQNKIINEKEKIMKEALAQKKLDNLKNNDIDTLNN